MSMADFWGLTMAADLERSLNCQTARPRHHPACDMDILCQRVDGLQTFVYLPFMSLYTRITIITMHISISSREEIKSNCGSG